MDNDLRPGNNRTLIIGLTTLLIFVAVTLGAWAFLEVDGILVPRPAMGEDAEESFSDLTGTAGDTARVVQLGTLTPDLDESSGVAVSRRYEGVVWSHNDGSENSLFAIRPDGTLLNEVEIDVEASEDWEDIALGPCPAGHGERASDCLYIGDIGDNDAERESMAVVVIQEPDPSTESAVPVLGTIRFRYPDGPADTEALAVSPRGEILLVTKGTDGSGRLYRLVASLEGAGIQDAALIGPLPTATARNEDWITGAAISPDGRTLAIRNHHAVYLTALTDPLGAPLLCEIGIFQPQGEGIDFLDAQRLLLTSEEEGGRAPVVRLRCP